MELVTSSNIQEQENRRILSNENRDPEVEKCVKNSIPYTLEDSINPLCWKLIPRIAGFFSVLQEVYILMKLYEYGAVSGFTVDYGTEGWYYEASYGPNWFNYYFQPVSVGKVNDKCLIAHVEENIIGVWFPYMFYHRHQLHEFIQKHLHILPSITAKIDKFQADYFKNDYIVGIHYRGTEKIIEYPLVAYDDFLDQFQELTRNISHINFKIFIASEEQLFLDFMQQKYGSERILFRTESQRSSDHSEVRYKSPHDAGEDALINCVLLSRTNFLVGTISNLNIWSAYFNPDMPFFVIQSKQPSKSTHWGIISFVILTIIIIIKYRKQILRSVTVLIKN